jgi:hypothetical protein
VTIDIQAIQFIVKRFGQRCSRRLLRFKLFQSGGVPLRSVPLENLARETLQKAAARHVV